LLRCFRQKETPLQRRETPCRGSRGPCQVAGSGASKRAIARLILRFEPGRRTRSFRR
jgi:hypothetical protein